MRRSPLAGCAMGLLLCQAVHAQAPVISEFVASNAISAIDQDGEASDWIEIHNPGGTAINLAGYSLSDDRSKPRRWVFPAPTWVGAGGYLLVFASGKDRATSGQQLHTDFKLKAEGEYLGLFDAGGNPVSDHGARYPDQYTDISYGFEFSPGLTSRRAYFSRPSPGAANGLGSVLVSGTEHSPAVPTATQACTVTAILQNPNQQTVGAVQLWHRSGYGAERQLAMRDDGQFPDPVAYDGRYTAQIAASNYRAGDMLRWRVVVIPSQGSNTGYPAYLSSTRSPRYVGTMVADPGVVGNAPVFYWWTSNPLASTSTQGARASVFFGGEFYDNVFVRSRGSSSLGYPKQSLKFDFNRGAHLRYAPSLPRVEEINLNTTYADKAYLRQVLAYETFRDAGGEYSETFAVRQQRNGQFFMVSILTEQVDAAYLERQGLDPNGALYKCYHSFNSSSASRNEKKTRKHEGLADIQALIQGVNQSGSARENFIWDNIDLPACINYWACVILMHDNDCVHKNYYLYRDSDGDREWRFLPWDKDLVFGRNYTRGGGVLNDTIWTSRDPQGHPLFGDSAHRKIDNYYNRLIHGMFQSPRIRAMYLRRLRSLMDELLDAPGTPLSQRYYERRISQLVPFLKPDLDLDQSTWGVPRYGDRNQTWDKAVQILQSSYLDNRRRHLFNTHSSLIPAAQAAFGQRLSIGKVEVRPGSNDLREQYVQVINSDTVAVDLSGWVLRGAGIEFGFAPGTVIAAGADVYVAADAFAFRNRTVSPRGGQGRFVVGPFAGSLQSHLGLVLYNAQGMPVTETGEFQYRLSTAGNGDAGVSILGAAPKTQLWTLFSVDQSGAPGSGPILGLGLDVLPQIGLPLGTPPVHVLTDGLGRYSFTAPAGTLAKGVTLTSRAAYLDARFRIVVSEVQRVTF